MRTKGPITDALKDCFYQNRLVLCRYKEPDVKASLMVAVIVSVACIMFLISWVIA